LQSPFSRVGDLTAKQVISQYEEQHNEQDCQQGAAEKEGQQHTHCNPKQNKPEYFSHGRASKRLIIIKYAVFFQEFAVFLKNRFTF